MVYDIKRRLVDFETTSINKTYSVLSSGLQKDAAPTNREFIGRKGIKFHEAEGVNTFKGHKVIHIHNDVEGNSFFKSSAKK